MPETCAPGRRHAAGNIWRAPRERCREPRLTLAFATGFLRFFLDYGLFTYLPLLVALRYGATADDQRMADRRLRGRLDRHRDQHRPHLRRVADRAAAGGRVLRERHRRSASSRSARRCGRSPSRVPVRARQRTDLAVAEEPADAAHAAETARRRDLGRSRHPADREIAGAGPARARCCWQRQLEAVFWSLAALSAFGMLVLALVSLRPGRP